MRSAIVFFVIGVFACGQGGAQRDGEPGGSGGSAAGGGEATGGRDGGLTTIINLDGSQNTGGGCGDDTCRPPENDAGTGILCGNGVLDPGETCDDRNSVPGDGCSGICQIEPNFVCSTPGLPCLSTVVCGDGLLGGAEACDDRNTLSGDGCSASCQLENGWRCPTLGQPCVPAPPPSCGNGVVDPGESCDDGNRISGDGCASTCQIENGYACPMPGTRCTLIQYCGDGMLNGTEQCDDGNTVPGDGCTGACTIEPFYACPTPGRPCESTIVCGDLKVTGDEACDDGNTVSGDGCSADCKQVEPGYTCPTQAGIGGFCQPVLVPRCGDARLSATEYCDDGNTTSGDGCSSSCTIEPGYTCPTPGMTCVLVARCGDGRLSIASGEQCDDGNTGGGDGCSAQCLIEANSVCPTPGQPCVSTVRCGDRKVNGSETCDDGNTVSGDGCSSICQLECGWTCPAGGACHATRCGDGLLAGTEQCDDANTVAGDGCSSSCMVESMPVTRAEGWFCATPTQVNGCVGPTSCAASVCGNGMRQGSEQCDDANNDMGDGCSPFCRLEPVCPPGGGACATVCGDGLLLPFDKVNGQECDDGNTISGDGCSSTCKVETGFACTDTPINPNPLILPIVYHDFKGFNEVGGHPDFENYIDDTATGGAPGQAGIAQSTLSATNGGVPVHAPGCIPLTSNNCGAFAGTDWFAMWYVDTPLYNRTIVQTLTLPRQASGAFQFSSGAFFPIDGLGWGNTPGFADNFGFTSEVRYWFQYAGTANLTFTGDDDVWVFINKQLAVDLGGLHEASTGSITLNPTNGTGVVCDFVSPCDAMGLGGRTINLGLQLGNVFESVVFQAERHTVVSNYTLTLSNFAGTRSSCASVCGDGIVTIFEACDLGTARNTGAYGTCNPDCTLSPYCGDAVVQVPPEQCDDGVNITLYGGTTLKCAPGCIWAPYCGDGRVDGANGEACDDGANNGRGYGFCTVSCQLGPRCGDGVVTNGEQCDDGVNNGTPTSKCMTNCQLLCGNGVLDAGEQCDNGAVNNTGGYGKCNPNCTLGPYCGDGIKNGTEQCDDGKNDGSYGTCAPGCVLGPRCGDGVVQTGAGEVCDAAGANQSPATAYGTSICTTRCLPAPYCGDKAVDVSFGEACDDGVNSGQPGSCTPDCKSNVPLPSCGDGIKDPGEQCDDGANNGSLVSVCDIHCRFKCGNGFRDPGEQCDNGVNNGSYGTCNANCTLAPYCGDGIKNGPEACDLGAGDQPNPYGPGTCTTMCAIGPYCGDGRIQTDFGEQCDSTSGCDPMCKFIIVR